jgi:uncharacterized membrane protein YhaH (DUF805 family)
VTSPFSFKGDIGRAAYVLSSLAAFLIQHVFAWAVLVARGLPFGFSAEFWLIPARFLGSRLGFQPDWVVLVGLLLMLLSNWVLIALAYRRMRTTGHDEGWVLLAAVPCLQLLLLLGLGGATAVSQDIEPVASGQGANKRAMALGLLSGVALCLGAVAVSTLVFHVYGYSLFVFAPIVIGASVAIIANRSVEVGAGKTIGLVMATLGLGALALMAFAFEGFICILMASPLIAFMGLVGALVGVAISRGRRNRGRGRYDTLKCIVLLPLALLGEFLFRPAADFESVESIVIDASAQEVWDSVVHMNPIPDAPVAPFRWGLAYPLRGEINGEGVGAVRRGVFSTGVAYERVVVWEPERRLSFIVLSDPPSMHELSPYKHVNAPHGQSYFRTRDARFTITPLAKGRTRLTLATHHDLDLDPALYWLPMAQWAVHANKVRVLRHFRQQAEAAVIL